MAADWGVKSESSARCSGSWQYDDEIKGIRHEPHGLVIQIADKGRRGRDHEITIGWAVFDRIAESRHGIAQLKQNLLTLKGMLDDISKIAVGAPYAMEPEEELTDA